MSAKTLNNTFNYLNRHWVKRMLDEGGHTVYYVYSVKHPPIRRLVAMLITCIGLVVFGELARKCV